MKNKHVFILLLAALLLCLNACSSGNTLIGTWALDGSFLGTYDAITFNKDNTFLWTRQSNGTVINEFFNSFNGTYRCSKGVITFQFSEGPSLDFSYSIKEDQLEIKNPSAARLGLFVYEHAEGQIFTKQP